ncbi:hypothetical protein C5688_06005 [Methylocystis sp. MitZ-2018]|nr:hypothetical protein C5688_06005 [Methylocystis sp. MitZ-2018]
MPGLAPGIHARPLAHDCVDGRTSPAMTFLLCRFNGNHAVLTAFSPSAAWAAASRAIGTRNGEQDT